MPSIKINKQNPSGSFFLTLTVKNWFYIFDRHNRWEILADSLEFCKKKKNIKLFGFVFMLNHVHLIVMSENVIEFLRAFKTFTSREIHKNIIRTEPSVEKIFLKRRTGPGGPLQQERNRRTGPEAPLQQERNRRTGLGSPLQQTRTGPAHFAKSYERPREAPLQLQKGSLQLQRGGSFQRQQKNEIFQLWQTTNMPKFIESEKFLFQKLNYIHNNPVRKKYVNKPEDWYWSSANSNCRLKADGLWE